MKSIKEIGNISGKRILVRVDFNVPMKPARPHEGSGAGGDGKIIDDFRIRKSLPTIDYLHKKGAIIILLSHLGEDGKESLAPVALRLKKYIPKVNFIKTAIFSDETEKIISDLKKGDIILLENLRREPVEKNNSPSFARALSRYGEIYVNEAFSVSHRVHASIVGITKYLPGFAGLQFMEEIKNLSRAFDPEHPFLFILGGAKFETKIPLIKKFLRDADFVFVSGALANDFFKAKGYEVGVSLVDNANFQIASLLKRKNLLLPIDAEVIKGSKRRFVEPNKVDKDENIVDVGPRTVEMLKGLIEKSKFILWNGPLGKYESGFGGATEQVLKMVSKSKAYSIIGGGDTVALVSKLKLENNFGFVSTGGGATLDFLAKGTLPGIKALK
ncbi:MAG TPA: phosphoglycerate kinase [Candidatus Paceibacterota bacterium]|nr:phosphoglycerate kinase [Candidatus Paceibacterota bacterium]